MSRKGIKNFHLPEAEYPVWRKFIVESNLPEKLSPLRELSRNLWWVWNTKARDLFQKIDEKAWEECEHNPIVLLDKASYKRFLELEKDDNFILHMHDTYNDLKNYLKERENPAGPQIAYFSMEYGLHDSLKIFSGGLGVLAGDYLKEASDSKTNLIGVGLLYRYGYFKQTINLHGEQMANYESQHFSQIPVQPAYDENGNWVEIEVTFPGRILKARVWKVLVGSVILYLLDTDYDANEDHDRFVTHHLYGGDNENRLKQEILLGLGGIRALNKLGYDSDIFHCNEGHAAFIVLERTANLISRKNLTFQEAKEVVTASTLFTTHTPVPAGHDAFHINMFKEYMRKYPAKLNLTWDEFVAFGMAREDEDYFNMSYLACHFSQGINGVSKLHGDVSKTILKDLYTGFLKEELEIGYVTNGVHYSSWVAKEWRKVHERYFNGDFPNNQIDVNVWDNIYKVPNEEIWELRQALRLKLINYIKQRFTDTWIKRHENPKLITEILGNLNPKALTIGFARRFATYKRAHLLFNNLSRLTEILNNEDRPVQFLFAGKAHPADKAGQDLIKYIVEISKRPELRGKVLFIQNYDINLAKMLLQGVDVWLNTPTRPLEASGTSGEKGAMNGTLHFSVLDGWWVEGYKKDAGWALPLERAYDVQDYQDELDAETIYNILEDEIIESFYDRDKEGVPDKWVGYIKNTIALVAPHFTSARMLHDYQERYYKPQYKRTNAIKNDDFRLARELTAWKNKVSSIWDTIEVVNVQISDGLTNVMKIGHDYPVKATIDLKGLSCDEVGLEMIITENNNDADPKLVDKMEFEVESFEGT
ncbi:MAG: glycosyltransferase family 1 protein, partial [Chlorobi bacterium]|nr:glycosyltransferase family 1 protein [Chlorobiota bacterium]